MPTLSIPVLGVVPLRGTTLPTAILPETLAFAVLPLTFDVSVRRASGAAAGATTVRVAAPVIIVTMVVVGRGADGTIRVTSVGVGIAVVPIVRRPTVVGGRAIAINRPRRVIVAWIGVITT
jgi:hypothetical protein